jgi:hypothetical protein
VVVKPFISLGYYGPWPMGIRFSNGNANRVTVVNFLSGLWSLIDNQLALWLALTTQADTALLWLVF